MPPATISSRNLYNSLHDFASGSTKEKQRKIFLKMNARKNMKSTSETNVCRKRRLFRDLSREFLNSQMRQHFITEVLLFGLLFAVSVWPILSLADALSASLE
ncbi:MAG: hypothetical protein DME43_15250 [Verrucomicrobia bacterium]|nr:MAG: hypothetical protein DME43_15250 [Verrucomicrobiota bacterium]